MGEGGVPEHVVEEAVLGAGEEDAGWGAGVRLGCGCNSPGAGDLSVVDARADRGVEIAVEVPAIQRGRVVWLVAWRARIESSRQKRRSKWAIA